MCAAVISPQVLKSASFLLEQTDKKERHFFQMLACKSVLKLALVFEIINGILSSLLF